MGVTVSQLLPVVATDVAIQAAAFAISAPLKTEKFYDISGSLTYAACIGVSLLYRRPVVSILSVLHPRQKLVSLCAGLWCIRLGTFLGYRVLSHGKDSRFDHVKGEPSKYWVYWAMQALWILLTAMPVYAINLLPPGRHAKLGLLDGLGFLLWTVGFGFEAISDYQKLAWQSRIGEDRRKTEFINEGLWTLSRHPNYFGEMTLWIGNYLMCASALRHSGFIGLKAALLFSASPIFVTSLIYGLSGVPILEKNSEKKFGHLPEYQKYVREVPVLIPGIHFAAQKEKKSE